MNSSEKIAQKSEQTARELIAFLFSIFRIIGETALFPWNVIAIVKARSESRPNEVGSTLYLIICSFIAISVPNHIATIYHLNEVDKPSRFSDLTSSLSFESILIRVLPMVAICYALSSYFAKRRFQSSTSGRRFERYLDQYIFCSGFSVLYLAVAVIFGLLSKEKVPENFEAVMLTLIVGAFVLIVAIIQQSIRESNCVKRKTSEMRSDIAQAIVFVSLIWIFGSLCAGLEWKYAPEKEVGQVELERAWLESTGSTARIVLLFVNKTDRYVYWRPGQVTVGIGANLLWVNWSENWRISQEASRGSLCAPGAANTVVLTSVVLDNYLLKDDYPYLAIAASELKDQNERDYNMLSMPGTPAAGDKYEVKLDYAQSIEEREAIGMLWRFGKNPVQ